MDNEKKQEEVLDIDNNQNTVINPPVNNVEVSSETPITPAPTETIYDSTSDTLNKININTDNLYSSKESKRKFLSDSEMLYAFIGKNYQRFIMGEFNFPAFFLSALYLLYRKMYFYSFLVTIIYVVASTFLKNPLYLAGVVLLISFIVGLSTNKLYIKHCRNKIDNIRYKYSYFNNEELLEVCKKKGGTSILSVIFGLILHFLVIILFVGLYLYFIVKIPFMEIFKKIIDYYLNNPVAK